MKNIFLSFLLLLTPALCVAQEDASQVFDLIDLNYPGLEKVKDYYNQGESEQALAPLLDYYRGRK